MRPDDVAVAIVALNGGELVGRTRLQKSAFLLDKAGMNSGLEFVYHHYGPFSVELARGWEEAEFDDRLGMAERPGSQEMPYTVFTTNEPAPARLGGLRTEEARELLRLMQGRSDVVLELAATMVFLRPIADDPVEEVKVLKPHKATPKRLAEAESLIEELGLGDE